MNCPSCGAPMRLEPDEDCLKCEYCHAVYFPEKGDDGVSVLPQASDEACPICVLPLMHAALAKMRILYCTQCRGMLMPMAVFTPIVEELRNDQPGTLIAPAPDPHDLQRKVDCPHCHRRMDTHYYNGPGNVIVDDCEYCLLIWLDHGEIMRIVRAPDYSHMNLEDAV